jgi:hypothetical protein
MEEAVPIKHNTPDCPQQALPRDIPPSEHSHSVSLPALPPL